MANDVAVTAGVGTTIATDEVGGKHHQLMKLVDGTEDSTARIPGDATNGLDVDVTRVVPGTGATNLGKAEDTAHSSGDVGVMALAVRNDAGTVLAGTTLDYVPLTTDSSGALRVTGGGGGIQYNEGDTDASITGTALLWEDGSDTLRVASAAHPVPMEMVAGSMTLTSGADPLTVGNDFDVMELVPTISTSAYSINDVIGGRLQLANALGTVRTGLLQSLFVQWKGALTPDLDFYFFNAQPTQNTADNGAFAWSTSDDAKLIWIQHVLTANYITIPGATTRTFAPVLPGLPALKSSGSGDLWVYIIAVDAVTAASTSDLRVGFGIKRD